MTTSPKHQMNDQEKQQMWTFIEMEQRNMQLVASDESMSLMKCNEYLTFLLEKKD